MTGRRLDQELVSRGLARSRAVARRYVQDGAVLVSGKPAHKPSAVVSEQTLIEVTAGDEWVGRAAYKMVRALEVFDVDPAGKRCIDVGASTGGFTQVLLSRGATAVEAIDVGHGQLAQQLQDDDRVTERSGTNIRTVRPQDVGGAAPLVVADLSFISLRLTLDPMSQLLTDDGDLVTLVKPQFEVGRERLARTGVVSSGTERSRAVTQVIEHALSLGLLVCGLTDSPIEGSTGNHEYLLWLRRKEGPAMDPAAVTDALARIARGEAIESRVQ